MVRERYLQLNRSLAMQGEVFCIGVRTVLIAYVRQVQEAMQSVEQISHNYIPYVPVQRSKNFHYKVLPASVFNQIHASNMEQRQIDFIEDRLENRSKYLYL